MHRTFFVPRLVGFASLLAALTLGNAALGQQPFQPGFPQDLRIDQQAPTITIAVGAVQSYTAKNDLKSVENPNSKVLNITGIKGDLRSVRLEGISPGRTRVTFTDVKNNIEVVDVVVISDRVKELREIIARSLPTAAINVTSTDSGTTVIITGTVLTADDMRVLAQLAASVGGNVINNVRIGGVQQVQLEVIVALVNRSEARNMAFSFNANGAGWFASSLFGTPLAFTSAINPATAGSTSSITQTGAANIPFGVLNGSTSFLGFLQALRGENLAKIISEPRVTTLSGRPAYIISGGETPLLTSGGQGAPSISYKQFGTVVHFLPIVLGNGKIHLEVRPEISDVDAALGISIPGITPTIVPGFRTRSAQVTVQIDEGQTLAIGGLIQNTINASITRVPVLGDLPGIGVLFSQKTFREDEQELIILVTPRLVDPVDCCKIPKFLPGRETRSADDFELFLEGIMEAPRGPRNVVFHPHLYKPAFHGAPNTGIPCGDACRGGRHHASCANGACSVPTTPSTTRTAVYTTPAATMPQATMPVTHMPQVTTHAAPMPQVTTHAAPMPQVTMPATSMPVVTIVEPSTPLPTYPEVQALPTSNPRVTVEAEPMPPVRQSPGLGPVSPSTPLTPARQFESRPSLPPLSPSGYVPR